MQQSQGSVLRSDELTPDRDLRQAGKQLCRQAKHKRLETTATTVHNRQFKEHWVQTGGLNTGGQVDNWLICLCWGVGRWSQFCWCDLHDTSTHIEEKTDTHRKKGDRQTRKRGGKQKAIRWQVHHFWIAPKKLRKWALYHFATLLRSWIKKLMKDSRFQV